MAGSMGADELRKLAAELAQFGPQVRQKLWRDLRIAAVPAATDAQGAILSGASAGEVPYHQPPGLRAQIAATVGVETSGWRTGEVRVSIVSRGSKMPPGKDHLPQLADIGTWRAPLFGNREYWHAQVSPKPGWFTPTVLGHRGRFIDAAEHAVNEAARQVDRG